MSEIEARMATGAAALEAQYRTAADGSAAATQPPPLQLPQSLIDVAYTVEDSPVGRLLLATTRRGVVRVAYLEGPQQPTARRTDEVLAQLAGRISPRVVERRASLDPLRRQLDEFFTGHRRQFSVKLDWQLTGGFAQAVLRATARVPFGQLTSYKGVATAAGSPRAYRAAGTALGSNPMPIIVPCHRVLHSDGGLGGYTGGLERKLTLLKIEGFPAGP